MIESKCENYKKKQETEYFKKTFIQTKKHHRKYTNTKTENKQVSKQPQKVLKQ